MGVLTCLKTTLIRHRDQCCRLGRDLVCPEGRPVAAGVAARAAAGAGGRVLLRHLPLPRAARPGGRPQLEHLRSAAVVSYHVTRPAC